MPVRSWVNLDGFRSRGQWLANAAILSLLRHDEAQFPAFKVDKGDTNSTKNLPDPPLYDGGLNNSPIHS